jgi:DNA-binding NtrC family response regulator
LEQLLNKPRQIRVLFVDDDLDVLKSAKECLNLRCSFDIELASSVKIAYEQMGLKNYDAIICDVQMPVTDGFEFLRELREKGSSILFIVFTVTENKETALKAFSLGANGFVGKCGKPEAVFSTLRKCLTEALDKRPQSSVKQTFGDNMI